MLLCKPTATIEAFTCSPTQVIEAAGRTCYRSEGKAGPGTADDFCRKIRKRGHLSVFEHASFTVRFVTDRGVSHELVRHRLAAYSQESTRYCDYGRQGVAFIIPPWVIAEPGSYSLGESGIVGPDGEPVGSGDLGGDFWLRAMIDAEETYQGLRQAGWSPQKARSVLPNSLRTEIVMTANAREWRHVFGLRTSKAAHPQMREVMEPLAAEFARRWPALFDDADPAP